MTSKNLQRNKEKLQEFRNKQELLDKYFLARARDELQSTAEGCSWCEAFINLKFTCCLNCGYIIEALE